MDARRGEMCDRVGEGGMADEGQERERVRLQPGENALAYVPYIAQAGANGAYGVVDSIPARFITYGRRNRQQFVRVVLPTEPNFFLIRNNRQWWQLGNERWFNTPFGLGMDLARANTFREVYVPIRADVRDLATIIARTAAYMLPFTEEHPGYSVGCLLYTSDAADATLRVDLGGRSNI